MAPGQQVRQIKISVDTNGDQSLKKIADGMSGLNRNVKSLASSFDFLKNSFLGYFSALGVGQITRVSDEMQLLGDRIKVLSGGTEQASKIFEELLLRANRTKTTVESLAGVYARFSAATKETKISTSALLDVVEILQNSFRLAGSGFQEANSAAIQLSQGLASGQLRGQELRSVLEANVVVGDLLAKQFNVTRGQLFKLAEAGELTANKVLLALLKNFDAVNNEAIQLSQTFEQTTIVAMNKFKFAVKSLNEEFGVSGKFARGVDLFIQKFSLIATIVGVTAVGALLLFGKTLVATALKFILTVTAINPFVAAFAIISVAIVTAFKNLQEFTDYLTFTGRNIATFLDKISIIKKSVQDLLSGNDPSKNSAIQAIQTRINLREKENQAIFDGYAEEGRNGEAATMAFRARQMEITRLEAAVAAVAGKEDKLRQILGRINKAYTEGRINSAEYFKQVDGFEVERLSRGFRDGIIQLDKFNEGMADLGRKQLSREFNNARISFEEFNEAIVKNQADQLNFKFSAGIITLREYDEELNKISRKLTGDSAFRAGTSSFLDSIGTVGTNVADSIRNAFSSLEETFLEFTKSGRADFAKFTRAILDDLLKIIIRAAIIRPLAEGILGGLGLPGGTGSGGGAAGGSGGGGIAVRPIAFAKGAAFDSGVRKFAKGGVVTRPTTFGYGGGKTGLMGEMGSEAILPLQRGAGGNLGVAASISPVTINITNTSSAEVVETEKSGPNGERTIEFMIRDKVRQGIATGQYDKAFQTSYGLSRKGS